jgi:hypothetical protein
MRRISLAGMLSAVCVLALGIIGPAVAGAKSTKTKKSATTKVTCKLLVSDAIPADAVVITPPLSKGDQYGTSKCGKVSGLASDTFALQDSGDITGKLLQLSTAGSLKGSYDLTQAATQPLPTPYTFGNADYTGTVKITGGTGTYAKAKGKGTIACDTLDSIHYSCVEHLKLKLPAAS